MLVMLFGAISGVALADGWYFGFDAGPAHFRFGNDYWYGNDWYQSADDDVDFDVMLDGFGYWIYLPVHGRVWIPYVEVGWRPYSCGHWAYTSYGWMWISYEPWGWVPHHFGRWIWNMEYGWVWIPDYTWGPAWVNWSVSGGYIGWAPCPPAYHTEYNYYEYNYYDNRHYHWDGERRYGDVKFPYKVYEQEGWTFVGKDKFGDENIRQYALQGGSLEKAYQASKSSMTIHKAPARQEIEQWTGRRVQETSISMNKVKIGGKAVTMVRPKNQLEKVTRNTEKTENQFIRPAIERYKATQLDQRDESRSGSRERRVSDTYQEEKPNQPRSKQAIRTAPSSQETPNARTNKAIRPNENNRSIKNKQSAGPTSERSKQQEVSPQQKQKASIKPNERAPQPDARVATPDKEKANQKQLKNKEKAKKNGKVQDNGKSETRDDDQSNNQSQKKLNSSR